MDFITIYMCGWVVGFIMNLYLVKLTDIEKMAYKNKGVYGKFIFASIAVSAVFALGWWLLIPVFILQKGVLLLRSLLKKRKKK